MSSPRTDWEKWFYRVVILVGIVVWVLVTHPVEARLWLRHSGHVIPYIIPLLVLVATCVRRWRWLDAVGCAVLAWVAGMILFPIFANPGHTHRHWASCQSNLKQIAIACLQYEQD